MKISVIMPVYNGEKYLREAIDSILNQTFSDFEFIIINDCSADSTEDIIKSYDDSRIIYIKNEENLGVAETLNKGLEIAKGEYIARMDADDISLPTRFEKQVNYMENNLSCMLCGSNMNLFGGLTGKTTVPISDTQIRANLLFASPFAHPTTFIRHSFIRQNNLKYKKEYEGVEDYALWLDFACLNIGTMYNFAESLLNYRLHPSQVTKKNPSLQKEEAERKIKLRAIEYITNKKKLDFPILTSCKTSLNYSETLELFEECRQLIKHADTKFCPHIVNNVSNTAYSLYNKLSGSQLLNILTNYSDISAFTFKRFTRLSIMTTLKLIQGAKTKFFEKIRKKINSFKLKNKNFTIISNNCWGGLISIKYGLPYRSPTCGLLILGNDYIKFCSKIKHYLNCELKFIKFADSKYSSMFEGMNFPVAKLDDIEIYFMHYSSPEEASEKWYRRSKRINWDFIIYKISERETFTKEDMTNFANLPIENKLIFASSKYTDDTILIPELNTLVGDETPLLEKYFDEAKYFNSFKKRNN